MKHRSPLDGISDGIASAHKAYRLTVAERLGLTPGELDALVLEALATIGACADIGWKVGKIIGGEMGGAHGAAIGCAIGIIVVVGVTVYRVFFRPGPDGCRTVTLEPA